MVHTQASLGYAAVLPLLLLGVSVAESQGVGGSFAHLDSQVTVGDNVTVTDVRGRETQGTIAELSASSLSLIAGKALTKFVVADVETVSRRDSRWNGTLWGLAAGGVLGALLDRSLVEEYGRDDISAGSSLSLIATAAGIGAGIGFGIDAMIKGRRVIYSRPRPPIKGNATVSPRWRPGRMGVLVSLRF